MSSADQSALAGARPEQQPDQRPRSFTCEFCECTLFSSGEVKKKSDKARKMESAVDRLEKLDAQTAEDEKKREQEEADRIAAETSQHAPPDAPEKKKPASKFRVL